MKKKLFSGMWKKLGALLLVACLLAGTGAQEIVRAVDMTWDATDNGWYGQDSNMFVYFIPKAATTTKGAKIYCYYGTKKALTLPKKYGSYKLTNVSKDFSTYSMSANASGTSMQSTKFTSIKIPSGYTTIEQGAFANQTSLYRIQIPATVKTIDATAFSGCNLSKLTIVAPYGSYAETYARQNGINYSADTTLAIDTHGTTMYAGESKQISVLNNSRKVTWKSSKTSVATVDKNGTVTAKAAGSTKITATINGKAYAYTFKVLARTQANVLKVIWANYVTIGMSDYERAIAATNWLDSNVSTTGTSDSATVAFETGTSNRTGYANAYKKILAHYGMTAKVITGANSQADNSVIIASKAYTASTLASASGVDKNYTTTNCEGVALNKSTMTLTVGKTGTFKPVGISKAYTWTSSNTKVATVTKAGKVTAKGAGTCSITFKMDGKSYKCTVRVNK